MSDKTYLGAKVSELSYDDALTAVSGVSLAVDSDHVYFAGDESGRVVEADCPWGSQAMAESILAGLKSVQYRPFEASDAILDPASEIGDGVDVGGIYSQIAEANMSLDKLCAGTVSAPATDEIDDEYPYESSTQRTIERKLAYTRSLITKTSEEILLQVDDMGDRISSISTKLDSITLSVSNGSTSSTIKLTVDGVEVSSQNISMSGLVTYTGLSSGTTTIDGGCIKTGTISADRIDASNLYVNAAHITGTLTFGQLPSDTASTSDIPTSTSDLSNDSGFINSSQATTITESTVTAAYINAFDITAKNLKGQTVTLLDSNGVTSVGTISLAYSATYAMDFSTSYSMRMQSGVNMYLSNGSAWVQMLSTGSLTLSGKPIIINDYNFGSTLPSSGTYGQIFFLTA